MNQFSTVTYEIRIKIPRWSTGRPRSAKGMFLDKVMSRGKIDEKEFVFFKRQIDAEIKRFGYSGNREKIKGKK